MNDLALLGLGGAAVLGTRHALDPDHLIAVGGLAAAERAGTPPRLGAIGLAWGAGHAISLVSVGLLVIVLGDAFMPFPSKIWEQLVGISIIVVGIRIITLHIVSGRGKRGAAMTAHKGSNCLPAVGVGVLHGIAGSGGVTLLLLPYVPEAMRVPGLLVFAATTCLSMGLCATVLGIVMQRGGPPPKRAHAARMFIGVFSIVFGFGFVAGAG
ncbi:hypothetical protein [Croceicoccus bisphenolivorans]|uniref:hypothetical protein n=1 Tax=Croceicoccus bisphenolivorans TaxID=1783232 RepID=UPI00082E6959|nr:hypothetical protein [Croceicoccus bisphenolivorans]